MARRKTITREMILDAAYGLVVEEGFTHFTARGIAKRMGCSTQPLYLEFQSMGDLKQAVMDEIKNALSVALSRRFTDDPIVDLGLAYIYFALEHRPLYRAVFIEDHFGVDEMREFAITAALKRIADYSPAVPLSDDQRRNTITGLWIVATGIANLMAPGFITVTRAQMIDILRAVIHDFIVNGRFSAAAKPVSFNLTTM
ncbi:TetR/AcrR family transcriptional regulator [Lacticaseibacillus nasuensis]|uniref:TetR/AcrR family transcriptional regulator n=1 Tax=Lacticaseibacillus nasuensis TaxID=944671 RepID=UPI00224603D7|nr:TetR/AcrR family transcriptional regulator [Lacticaseibacillus nasuensis]MCX2455478.1 TetR/AcrR family transcriptional regulator [Lacticaseibacillus nasuensis]